MFKVSIRLIRPQSVFAQNEYSAFEIALCATAVIFAILDFSWHSGLRKSSIVFI